MTPTFQGDTAAAGGTDQPLVAERWLLASDDATRLFALPAALARAARQSPLLAWRLQHGLVQRLPLKALPEKLAEALASGASGVNLWAEMPADALDDLVWQQVPVDRQPQVTRQAWAADAVETTDDEAVEADAALLQALARPDAWAEVAWRLDGCEVPPVVVAGRGADAPVQAAGHAAAFAHWASTQWQGLDAADLAGLRARDSVRGDLDVPAHEQPAADAMATPLLPVLEPAQPVRPAAGRRRPAPLHGAPAPFAAAPAGAATPAWTLLHAWECATRRRPGDATPPHYRVILQGDGSSDGPHTRLQLRVLLREDVWSGRINLQLWFVPEDDVPLQLRLRSALPEDCWLVSITPLPPGSRNATVLAEWLRACQVVLSAESAGG